MGKPYREELEGLAQTTLEAYALPIERLKRAIEDDAGQGLVVVASGGSQTAAYYLAQLHEQAFGHVSRVVSPLVFQSQPTFRHQAVWLLSAGGSNEDILNAARHAIAGGAQSITALVGAEDTPLQLLLATYGASRTVTFVVSAGRDGFLATNSLWASCLLVERAYGETLGDGPTLTASEVTDAVAWAKVAVDSIPDWTNQFVGIGDPVTMVGMSDLEMRATEAALASVWVADLRNLAHGRHFWFATHGKSTHAICLSTAPYRALATQTMKLIQEASPVDVIEVPGSQAFARLASVAFSMHAALRLGEQIHRDPGRPGVPPFGEALYHLRYTVDGTARKEDRDRQIILAKLGRPDGTLTDDELATWRAWLQQFRSTLASADIRAVVFDFDGTLIESSRRYEPMEPTIIGELTRLLKADIHIGIATGRGDSCGIALRNSLSPNLWSNITIGYHNGALTQPIGDIELAPGDTDPAIIEAVHRIERYVLWPGRGRCRVYETQCSVSMLDGRNLSEAWQAVYESLHDLIEDGLLRIWMSSHSIDVVSSSASKLNVVSLTASRANCLPEQVLCIGDRGRWPGNDAELLGMPLSLSSDQCSTRPDRCWNLAGMTRRQVAATCYQLQLFDASNGVLRFKGG